MQHIVKYFAGVEKSIWILKKAWCRIFNSWTLILHANHEDFPKGISMFLATSYKCLTFGGELEDQSLHHLCSPRWKPKVAVHQLHSQELPASRDARSLRNSLTRLPFWHSLTMVNTQELKYSKSTNLLVFSAFDHTLWIYNITQRFAHL